MSLIKPKLTTLKRKIYNTGIGAARTLTSIVLYGTVATLDGSRNFGVQGSTMVVSDPCDFKFLIGGPWIPGKGP